jgi:DNA-binding NarL/FixJ family response regulator
MISMHILIADNQPRVRFALRVALEQQLGFKTVGEAIDGDDLITQATAACPDLAIVDWELPDLPMADLIHKLRDQCRQARVIILSSRNEMCDQAFAAGANAFVCMGNAPDELAAAIETCFAHQARER